jgi:hypothetical protein
MPGSARSVQVFRTAGMRGADALRGRVQVAGAWRSSRGRTTAVQHLVERRRRQPFDTRENAP